MADDIRKPNDRLRQQRLQRSWTLEHTADELYKLCEPRTRTRGDINANMISRWERGKHPPSPFWQERLCALYGKTPEELGFIEAKAAPNQQITTLPPNLSLIGLASTSFIIIPQTSLSTEHTSPNTIEDHLAFLETSMKNRWTLYHTAGAFHAYQGLSIWIQEIITCARALRNTIWHEQACILLAMSYQLQGCILGDLMQYPQAYQAHRKAFLVAQELYEPELMAAALAREGITLNQQEKPTEAITCFEKALEIIRNLDYHKLEGYILQALSEAQAKAQRSQESWSSIGLAERALEHSSCIPERSLIRLNIASVTAQKGVNAVLLHDFEQAIKLIDTSFANYDPALIRGRARLLAQKAEAHYGLGTVDACTAHAQEALKLAYSAGSSKTIARVRDLHILLIQSTWRKEQSVVDLGIALSAHDEENKNN